MFFLHYTFIVLLRTIWRKTEIQKMLEIKSSSAYTIIMTSTRLHVTGSLTLNTNRQHFLPNILQCPLADRGGGGGARDAKFQILSFSCSFWGKNWQNNRLAPFWRPLLRKILDPPLVSLVAVRLNYKSLAGPCVHTDHLNQSYFHLF